MLLLASQRRKGAIESLIKGSSFAANLEPKSLPTKQAEPTSQSASQGCLEGSKAFPNML